MVNILRECQSGAGPLDICRGDCPEAWAGGLRVRREVAPHLYPLLQANSGRDVLLALELPGHERGEPLVGFASAVEDGVDLVENRRIDHALLAQRMQGRGGPVPLHDGFAAGEQFVDAVPFAEALAELVRSEERRVG